MNIAYQGHFLREGLLKLGHNVLDLPGDQSIGINERIGKLVVPVDLVFLEMYGSSSPVTGLHACKHETAVWLIDSPLNEFWMRDAARLFDHVFVDQLSTVSALDMYGIKAVWLPLCVQDWNFAASVEKSHDLTFIGTVNQQRAKRNNLLKMLQGYRPNIVSGVFYTDAREILARSKISLNENLFDGLTLRIFQSLAAGSVAFTEKSAATDKFFRNGEHLVTFDHTDVLEKLDELLSSDARCREIALAGKEACAAKHTSFARAHDMIGALQAGAALNPRPCDDDLAWHEARATVLLAQRYGGAFGAAMRVFHDFAVGDSRLSAPALLEIGNVHARHGRFDQAKKCFRDAADGCPEAWAKLALLHNALGNARQARTAADRFLRQLQGGNTSSGIAAGSGDVFLDVAEGYMANGRTFDLGFGKPAGDIVPDTAFEAAMMSWRANPNALAMDIMLECLGPYGIEGELFPHIVTGIERGILSRVQMLRAAEIARVWYDADSARNIMTLLERTGKL